VLRSAFLYEGKITLPFCNILWYNLLSVKLLYDALRRVGYLQRLLILSHRLNLSGKFSNAGLNGAEPLYNSQPRLIAGASSIYRHNRLGIWSVTNCYHLIRFINIAASLSWGGFLLYYFPGISKMVDAYNGSWLSLFIYALTSKDTVKEINAIKHKI
jgi:hypothetical protein